MEEINNKYKGFTLGLAMVDIIPCIEFFVAGLLINTRLCSSVFLLGVVLSFTAGAGKVIWKLILALKKKDVAIFAKQFRFTMPAGFLLMIIGAAMRHSTTGWLAVWTKTFSFPGVLFVILLLAFGTTMFVCRGKLSQTDSKNNWIEQAINIGFQGCFLLYVIYIINFVNNVG